MKKFLILTAAILTLASCAPQGEYRNLAHFRAAYQSSSYDFDQTVQLITDGIVETQAPELISVYANGKLLPQCDREWPTDWARWTSVTFEGSELSYVLNHGSEPIVHDAVRLVAYFEDADIPSLSSYKADFYCSQDGQNWDLVASDSGKLNSYELWIDLPYKQSYSARSVKVDLSVPGASSIRFGGYMFFNKGEQVYLMDQNRFNSTWVCEGSESEWAYIDLGAKSSIDKVVLSWINRPLHGVIEFSNDAVSWHKVASLGEGDTYAVKGKARYVRISMEGSANGEPLALSEMEVWGRNSVVLPKSDWTLARESEAQNPDAWIPATVPGTVLASYLDAGALPDVYYSDYHNFVSQSYFRSNFIYKGVLRWDGAASNGSGEKVWLNFDGINWKADVKMNGVALGHIAGAFTDAHFDVTDIVKEGDNEVEVKIYKHDHPGVGRQNTREREAYNGGILGADNPTFHCNIGWDWIPSLPGRSLGIWNDVYLSRSGVVTIEDPYITSVLNLPDTTHADVTLKATLVNHGSEPVAVKLSTSLENGEKCSSEKLVALAGGESKTISEIYKIDNPKLWWPNGYGEQNLYDVSLVATIDEETSDSESFLAGIRQMTYDTSDGRLTGWVNGRRFMAKGGNWGFSELNLRYTQREYDKAVAYHAQQNFTMIRNWVGQTGDEEFYQACDKYGIMVWQDFWLANPYDGPDPFDEAMFMQNADNYVRRIRNHPSIALYCGRNEGNPPASLDGALRDLVAQLTDIQYISHSSRGLVSGEGKYCRISDREFFEMRGNDRIHSERGMPNIMNYESLVKMIPQEQAWPIGQLWAEHDWAKNSAMRSETFTQAVYSMFGDEVPSAERYCSLAQWVNYNGYRAMFEGRSLNRRGVLLWMSHSCWPSLVWSTYDYWFDPTGAFYGCKKACEPFHIQYNASTHKVEVVNVSGGSRKALAKVEVMDMYGKVLSESSAEVCSEEDTTIELSAIDAPAGQEVYFLRLKLSEAEKDGAIVSENFYVLGAEEDNLKALCALPAAKVSVKESVMKAGQEWVITATLTNTSKVPAMMLHIAPYACGERVLPYDAQDNYFHLMPGESRQITVRMDASDVASCGSAHGAKPSLRMNGFNC